MDSHPTPSETTRPHALPPTPWVGASPFRRYALAVVATALAFLVTRQIASWLQPNVLSLFFGAVLVSAWYGGLGPGLLAALLSLLTAGYFFAEPVGSFRVQYASDAV